MKTLLILLLAVAVASAATTRRKRATYEASLNNYVDEVISNLQAYITENNHDSISVPNITQSFSVKPLFITYSGHVSLYNGILSNLATIKRYGDITLTYSDQTLGLSANLGIDSIDADYTYQSRLLGFLKPSGTVDGNAVKIDTSTSLSANLKTYTLALNSFAVNSVGSVSAKLRGNILTDWLANVILNIVVSNIKDDVTNDLAETVTSGITSTLDEVNAAIAAFIESYN